ncbi:Reverse transcriptase zinc-binding domain [Macleaya cordata]|uniref:Reverse transcriptase zinc-binding domain n=1 Tax=Macleaya cordata TaxID=56857 RepID=A0A200QNN6_MACCD|nr:Reverse transcriptase zinc-binding domain [Macleaya cordata]
MFAWRLLSGAITVRSAISKHIPNTPSECPLCGFSNATIDHLFIHCTIALSLPFASPLDYRVQRTTLTIQELFSEWLNDPLGMKKFCFGSTLLWCLWKARNDVIFRYKDINPAQIISVATNLNCDFLYPLAGFEDPSVPLFKTPATMVTTSWSPPPSGFINSVFGCRIHVSQGINESLEI